MGSRMPLSWGRWAEPVMDSRLPLCRWELKQMPPWASRLPLSWCSWGWWEEEPLWDSRQPLGRWEEEEPLWDSRQPIGRLDKHG